MRAARASFISRSVFAAKSSLVGEYANRSDSSGATAQVPPVPGGLEAYAQDCHSFPFAYGSKPFHLGGKRG